MRWGGRPPQRVRSRRAMARKTPKRPLSPHTPQLTTSPASNWVPVCLGNHTDDVTPSAGAGMSVNGWPEKVEPRGWVRAVFG